MTLRWITFFGTLLALLGSVILFTSRKAPECSRVDEFKQRQKEIQQATHTDYME